MEEQKSSGQNTKNRKPWKHSIYEFYDRKYKALLIIPFIILFFSLAQIGYQLYSTGDFVKKDVSLRGGVTLTIPYQKNFDSIQIQKIIKQKFPDSDVSVRSLRSTGNVVGIVVEAAIEGTDKEEVKKLLDATGSSLQVDLRKVDYGIEIIGSSLGSSFFRESLIALAVAFIFMGLVVFIYFRTLVPSVAVVLAAFSDMVFALAVINLMGVRIGTAGIAAFLMLIGYSVDTDILLTTRVLRGKEGSIHDRTLGAMRTGITMSLTALAAVLVGYFVSQSDVIKQIMLVLSIGLVFDIINTWITNAAILRWYLERKKQ